MWQIRYSWKGRGQCCIYSLCGRCYLWLEHHVKQSHCFQALSCYWGTVVLSGQVTKRTQVWGLRSSHLERLKIWIVFLVILRTEFVWAIKSTTESMHSVTFCEMDGLVYRTELDTSESLSLASHTQQYQTPCYKLMVGSFSSLCIRVSTSFLLSFEAYGGAQPWLKWVLSGIWLLDEVADWRWEMAVPVKRPEILLGDM